MKDKCLVGLIGLKSILRCGQHAEGAKAVVKMISLEQYRKRTSLED